MTPTAAEVLDAAKALPRAERAEVARELLATLGTGDEPEEARFAALHAVVDAGIVSLDTGKGIRIPAGGVRDYLRERGRLATAQTSGVESVPCTCCRPGMTSAGMCGKSPNHVTS